MYLTPTTLLLLLLAGRGGALAQPAPDDAVTAQVVQQALPALEARRLAATERQIAAARWFTGASSLDGAFPDLAHAPLDATSWIDGELRRLDRLGQLREVERTSPLPEGLPEAEQRRLTEALQATLDAEIQADQGRRRLLLALLAGLERAPGLRAERTEAEVRATWRAQLHPGPEQEATPSPPPDAGQETDAAAEQVALATAAGDALAALQQLSTLAWRAMSIPGDRALADEVQAQLAAPPAWGPLPAERLRALAWAARLERVAPLVEPGLREAIAAACAPIHAAALAAAEPVPEASPVAGEETEAQARRRVATEAEALAESTTDLEEAEGRRTLARLQSELADLVEAEARASSQASARLAALRERVNAASSQADLAMALPVLAVGREAKVDDAHRELRATVAAIRAEAGQLHQALIRSRQLEEELAAATVPSVPASLVAERDQVIADRQILAEESRRRATNSQVLALELLAETKTLRRMTRAQASSVAREESLSNFLPELYTELREAPLVLGAALRSTAATVLDLPRQVTNLRVLIAFASRSFEFILFMVGWLLVRRHGDRLSRFVLASLEKARAAQSLERAFASGWLAHDLQPLRPHLALLLRLLADLLVGSYLLGLSRDDLAPLALLVLLWLMHRMMALPTPVLRLLFSLPDESRPALRTVRPETMAMADRGARLVVGALRLFAVLHFISLDLFDADRATEIVSVARTAILLILALTLLHGWAPAIRATLASDGEQGRIANALARPPGFGLLAAPHAAAGLLLLGVRLVTELLVRLAEGRPSLTWLASALARSRLRTSSETARSDLPIEAELRSRLEARAPGAPRAEELVQMRRSLLDWSENRVPGLIAIVGEPGSGKSELLHQSEALCAEVLPDLPRIRLSLDGRQSEPQALLGWLAAALEVPLDPALPLAERTQALIDAIERRPASIYLIDDLHHAVLRAVGGFSGIKLLLRILHSTSEEHLWICTFHRPTWSYLTGVRSSINLDVFRLRIELEPLTGRALGDWVHQRASQAGLTLSFADLAGTHRHTHDGDLSRNRAEQAYWRLLTDASLGIPSVAWRLFVPGLRRGSSPDTAEVAMFHCPSSTRLETSSDFDLFVLAAIVVHDSLGTEALAEVLNAPIVQVQESCRQLEGMGVLVRSSHRAGATVPLEWWPAVRAMLRQKHFLSMR